jgi:hypothetical protein
MLKPWLGLGELSSDLMVGFILTKWRGRTTNPSGRIVHSQALDHRWEANLPNGSPATGSVDILPDPDESPGQVQEGQASGVPFLKPGENPAKQLHLVDATLHRRPSRYKWASYSNAYTP